MTSEIYDAWASGTFDYWAPPKQTYPPPQAYFQQSQQYAAASFDSAQSLFQQLAQISIKPEDIAPDFGGINEPGAPILAPPAGDPVPGTCEGSNSPCSIVDQIVGTKFPSIPGAPAYSAIPVPAQREAPSAPGGKPAIVAPPSPGYTTEQAPNPTALKAHPLPAQPSTTIPAAPELISYNVPGAPEIIRPVFDKTLEAAPEVITPELSFTEPEYVSPVKSAVDSRINAWLNAEDVSPDDAVWDSIFDKVRDREEEIFAADISEARRNVSSAGFRMPPGALNTAMRRARSKKADKLSSLNRERAVEQAKMSFENIRAALTQGVQYEGTLIRNADAVAQRAYQSAVWVGEAAKWTVNTKVELHNQAIQAYKVESDVYLAWLQAELSKLDEYRALLEAEKLKGEINSEQLEAYNLAIRAVDQQWEIYTKKLEGTKIVLAENEQIIKQDELLVRRYEAVTKGNADLWDAYSAQWEGEKIKGDLYKVDVEAYGEEVRGMLGLIEGDKIRSDILVSIEELKNRNFSAQMSGVEAEYAALGQKMDSLSRTLGAQAQMVDANGRYRTGMAQANAAVYRSNVDKFGTEKANAIAEAELSLRSATEAARIATSATQEAAKVAGQIASSALSVLHVSTSHSSSTSANTSNAFNESSSTSDASSTTNNFSRIESCDCE